MKMSNEGFILDTPEQINAFGLLQVWYKLKMEVNMPGGPTWRMSPAKQARAILVENGQKDPGRTKSKVFAAYTAWLIEIGVKQDDSVQSSR
jgi:hypothetical protein